MEFTSLKSLFQKHDVIIDESLLNNLSIYWEKVKEASKITDLTKITEDEEAMAKHFFDSYAPVLFQKQYQYTLGLKNTFGLDIGTGAGFPGVPLGLLFSNMDWYLVDARNKKINFLSDTSQIRITSRVAIDTKVLADDTELGRVFANLFENARRYGSGPASDFAEVEVGYARNGPWVVVSVRDHGPGVPPEKLPHLTTPFYRGNAARTAASGAGLGLAIVDKALHRMGGSLELANASDGGLVATLRLKKAP